MSNLEEIKTTQIISYGDPKKKLEKNLTINEIPNLSSWIQFLSVKASLRTNQNIGIVSIFLVGFIGVLSIYYTINNLLITITGSSVLVILYYGIIRKFLNKLGKESQKAEDLLDEIMNGAITDIKEIQEKWFSKGDYK